MDVVAIEVWMLPEAFEAHFRKQRAFAAVDWIHARDVDGLLGSDIDAEGGVWRKDRGHENQEGGHLGLLGNLSAEVDDIAIAERAFATQAVGHLGDRERPSNVRGLNRDHQLWSSGTPARVSHLRQAISHACHVIGFGDVAIHHASEVRGPRELRFERKELRFRFEDRIQVLEKFREPIARCRHVTTMIAITAVWLPAEPDDQEGRRADFASGQCQSMFAIGLLVGWLVLALAASMVAAWWSRRLWKKRTALSPRARTMAAIVAGAAMVGALGTLAGLLKAFGAVGGESVDPSQKARILAEGISEAINCTVFGIAIWLPSAIILSAMMRKRGPNPS